MTDKETYLGDGLYASFDGFQIRLRAPREMGDHEVFLETPVLDEFLRFVETTFNVSIVVAKPEAQEN